MNFMDRRTPTDKYQNEIRMPREGLFYLRAAQGRSSLSRYKNSRSQCENPVGSLEDISKDPTAVFTTLRLIIVTRPPIA